MASDPVKQFTDSEFETVIAGALPVFVEFWAPWCGPCRILGPIIEAVAPDYSGKAVLGKLNVDDNPVTPQRYGVTSIPSMMMFKGGKLVDRMVGAAPAGAIRQFIDRNL